jgi:hypothetical protein
VTVRAVARAILLASLLVAALTARVVFEGERQIQESTRALDAGDADTAIFHARSAALWFAPGAPHVRVAYARLMALGKEAEQRKLWDTALLSYRGVVSASASTRWLVAPHADDVREAESAILRIEGRKRAGAIAEVTEPIDVSQLEARSSASLRILLVAAFAGLIGGLSLVLWRGVDETGRLLARQALPGAALALLGFACYVVSLFLA